VLTLCRANTRDADVSLQAKLSQTKPRTMTTRSGWTYKKSFYKILSIKMGSRRIVTTAQALEVTGMFEERDTIPESTGNAAMLMPEFRDEYLIDTRGLQEACTTSGQYLQLAVPVMTPHRKVRQSRRLVSLQALEWVLARQSQLLYH
jgi:hypothetical protein